MNQENVSRVTSYRPKLNPTEREREQALHSIQSRLDRLAELFGEEMVAEACRLYIKQGTS